MSKQSDQKRIGMPLHPEIRNYWVNKIDFKRKNHCDEYEFLHGDLGSYFCFACGMADDGLERAHIKSIFDGGSNDASNIHILCKTCHKASEFITGHDYFDWFYKRDMITSLVQRAMKQAPIYFAEKLTPILLNRNLS